MCFLFIQTVRTVTQTFFYLHFSIQGHRDVPLRLLELLLASETEPISNCQCVCFGASRRNLQRSMPLSCAGTPRLSGIQGQYFHTLHASIAQDRLPCHLGMPKMKSSLPAHTTCFKHRAPAQTRHHLISLEAMFVEPCLHVRRKH